MRKYFKIKNSVIGPIYFYQETPIVTPAGEKADINKTLRDSKKHEPATSYYKSDILFYEAFTNYPAGISTKNKAFEWSNDEQDKKIVVMTFMETTWMIEIGRVSPYDEHIYFDNIEQLSEKDFQNEVQNIMPYRDIIINNISRMWLMANDEYKQEDIIYAGTREREQLIEEEKMKL